MRRHPFQPLVAIVGLVTIGAGTVVAAFGVERVDPAVGAAAVAAALGLAIIPWRGRADDDVGRHDDMT